MVPELMLEALIEVMVVPAPIKFAAVTLPAENAPLASRDTIVEAPLDADAVVRAFAIVPVEMLEAFRAVNPDPSPLTDETVIAPAENSPEAPRATIVLAPLELEAVVRAFAIVPVLITEALIAVTGIDIFVLPLKLVAVPVTPSCMAIVLAV